MMTIDKREFRRKNSETGAHTQRWLAGCFPCDSESAGRNSQPSQFPDDGTMIETGAREAQNGVRRAPLDCDGASRRSSSRMNGASLASASRRAAQQAKRRIRSRRDERHEGPGSRMNRYPSIAGCFRAFLSASSVSVLGVRQQECMPMQIMERRSVIVHRCLKQAAPERASVLAAWAQTVMMTVGDLPKLVQSELRDDLADFGGHSDQQSAEANVLPRRVPRHGQRITGHLHVDDPRKYAAAEFSVARSLLTLRSLPPRAVSEMKVGKDERTSARSVARLAFQCLPKLPVGAQDHGQGRCAFPLRRAHETLQIPVIECLHQLEARAATPTWHRYCGGAFWLFLLPGGWRQLFLSDATSISFGSFPLLSGPPSVSLA